MKKNLPRWSLESVYPSFVSVRFKQDIQLLEERIGALGKRLTGDSNFSCQALLELIHLFEEAGDTAENLSSYCEAVYTTNTKDSAALTAINQIAALKLPLGRLTVTFRSLLAAHSKEVEQFAADNKDLTPYQFFLQESIEKASYQMSGEMEDLANDLARSGADAWARLHAALSSTASAVWDDATKEHKTVIALRDLAHHEERAVRKKAYQAEIAAWKSVEVPMAAALNGIKGQAISLDTRRGWKNALQKSSFQSRISEATLAALISSIEDALPLFRSYLKTKASLLGIEKCAFYDLFAPVKNGNTPVKRWDWEDAAQYIIMRFHEFDPEMADFARMLIDASWVDAEGREGKIGGAYCVDFPRVKESRILCNFEGSFDSVTTLAHEIGHAWHSAQLRELSRFQSGYPMTLAETASIFAETIVFEGALKTTGPEEQITLLEGSIKDSCQVLVDILSRFYFESSVFERRSHAELSPEELCTLMLDAQRRSYGDGLDNNALHPYMWAAKVHYYDYGYAFYNYPYAFGQLFALALYARAQAEGQSFAKVYRKLLKNTGRMHVEEAAADAGFDITQKSFWQNSIAVIAGRIEKLTP